LQGVRASIWRARREATRETTHEANATGAVIDALDGHVEHELPFSLMGFGKPVLGITLALSIARTVEKMDIGHVLNGEHSVPRIRRGVPKTHDTRAPLGVAEPQSVKHFVLRLTRPLDTQGGIPYISAIDVTIATNQVVTGVIVGVKTNHNDAVGTGERDIMNERNTHLIIHFLQEGDVSERIRFGKIKVPVRVERVGGGAFPSSAIPPLILPSGPSPEEGCVLRVVHVVICIPIKVHGNHTACIASRRNPQEDGGADERDIVVGLANVSLYLHYLREEFPIGNIDLIHDKLVKALSVNEAGEDGGLEVGADVHGINSAPSPSIDASERDDFRSEKVCGDNPDLKDNPL